MQEDRDKDKGSGKIKQYQRDQVGRGGIKEEAIVDVVFILETTSVMRIVITRAAISFFLQLMYLLNRVLGSR